MFDIGEYVIYGVNGVCQIENVGTMDSGLKGRIYYTLIPVYDKSRKIFTPIDNKKVMMRKILSQEEAQVFISRIPDIETIWIPDEKSREEIYKEAIRTGDCCEWMKIIKTIYLRKEDRIAKGKKVTEKDERYFRIAEDNLYGELAIPLNIEKDEVEQYISDAIKK